MLNPLDRTLIQTQAIIDNDCLWGYTILAVSVPLIGMAIQPTTEHYRWPYTISDVCHTMDTHVHGEVCIHESDDLIDCSCPVHCRRYRNGLVSASDLVSYGNLYHSLDNYLESLFSVHTDCRDPLRIYSNDHYRNYRYGDRLSEDYTWIGYFQVSMVADFFYCDANRKCRLCRDWAMDLVNEFYVNVLRYRIRYLVTNGQLIG